MKGEKGTGENLKTDKGMKQQTVILWLSRHSIQDSQLQELGKVFGETRIVQVKKTHANIQEILNLAGEHNADEIVAVLPLNLIAQLCQTRFKPIRPVMRYGNPEEDSHRVRFLFPIHDHFERVLSVDVVSEPLRPGRGRT